MGTRATRSQQLHQAIVSVQALSNLLKAVMDDPARLKDNPNLERALRSQGALSKYSDAANGIHPMSLNHMKKVCAMALGSFSVMDALRRSVAQAAASARKPPPPLSKRESLIDKKRALEEERRWLLQDLFLLQRAYDIRCIQARAYAERADPATLARCKKEQAELDATFSLRQIQLEPGNVSSITAGRRRGTPR